MINPRKKSKYWVDDTSILPEMVVTPRGNYPILDDAGNPARTVGAIQDINPNAHIYERTYRQVPQADSFNTEKPQWWYDAKANALDQAHDLSHFFADLMTGFTASQMEHGWNKALDENASWRERASGIAEALSPALFVSPWARAYYGLTHLADEDGVQKTWDRFSNGDYIGGTKSAAGDVLNLLLAGEGGYNSANNALNFAASQGNKTAQGIQLARAINGNVRGTTFNVWEPLSTRLNAPIYNGIIRSSTSPQTISISPEDLYKFLNDQNGYYFMGHGTGRTPVSPETIFNSGLRIKKGDVANTTIPVSESNLTSWPHLNSEEVILLPGKVEMSKYDSPYGRIPTDWYDNKTFHWNDNPPVTGRGFFAVQEPHATFVESTRNGVPGIYTKPEAVLGSYNTRTNTLQLNPNSQYQFNFNVEPSTISWGEATLPTAYSREIRSPFYKYDENGKPIVFDTENVASLIRLGKQDFINEMLSPEYAEAAIRNMEEAKDMGLHYTPVFETEGFKSLRLDGIKPKFVKSPETWNASTSLFGGTLGRPSEINYNVNRPFDIRKATGHESGHVSRWGMGETPEEYLYMKYKSSLIFRDDVEVGAYDFKTQTGEGATNMRDLGKDMGITLRTPYPGYEEALRQLNKARETSHKGGIVDILRLDKEHMPYIWRALLGLHWGLVPGIVVAGSGYSLYNALDNNQLVQVQKFGGRILPPWHK